jgi:cell division initiation protein
MKVTPLDLRQPQLKTAVRGYDKTEVKMLLSDAADDYEAALREIDRLRQDVTRMEAALGEHRDREVNLRNTLLTAQKMADQIREQAEQEARMALREAEGRAEVIVQKAHERSEELTQSIKHLHQRRRDAEMSLESAITTLRSALDSLKSQVPAPPQEDRTVIAPAPPLGPRPVAMPTPAAAPVSTPPEPVTPSVASPSDETTRVEGPFPPKLQTPAAESEEEEMLAQLRQLALKHEQRAALRDL